MHTLISYNYHWQASGDNHCYDMHNDQNQVPIRKTHHGHKLQLVERESSGRYNLYINITQNTYGNKILHLTSRICRSNTRPATYEV